MTVVTGPGRGTLDRGGIDRHLSHIYLGPHLCRRNNLLWVQYCCRPTPSRHVMRAATGPSAACSAAGSPGSPAAGSAGRLGLFARFSRICPRVSCCSAIDQWRAVTAPHRLRRTLPDFFGRCSAEGFCRSAHSAGIAPAGSSLCPCGPMGMSGMVPKVLLASFTARTLVKCEHSLISPVLPVHYRYHCVARTTCCACLPCCH